MHVVAAGGRLHCPGGLGCNSMLQLIQFDIPTWAKHLRIPFDFPPGLLVWWSGFVLHHEVLRLIEVR